VSLNSQPLSLFADNGLDMGVYFAGFFTDGQLPLNALAKKLTRIPLVTASEAGKAQI
jgi:hypothetical protein